MIALGFCLSRWNVKVSIIRWECLPEQGAGVTSGCLVLDVLSLRPLVGL